MRKERAFVDEWIQNEKRVLRLEFWKMGAKEKGEKME